jgi:hypothetical protein
MRFRVLDAELWRRTTLGLASDLERLKRRIRPASVRKSIKENHRERRRPRLSQA